MLKIILTNYQQKKYINSNNIVMHIMSLPLILYLSAVSNRTDSCGPESLTASAAAPFFDLQLARHTLIFMVKVKRLHRGAIVSCIQLMISVDFGLTVRSETSLVVCVLRWM